MTTFAPDPKPEARHVADRDEWDRIVLAKAGPCRGCGAPGETFHHLVPKGNHRGDDVAANIVPLCGHGTVGCHGVITSHNRDGASGLTYREVAHAIRASLWPAELAYVLRKKGQDWLAEFYPSGPLSKGELSSWDPSESSLLCARCRRLLKDSGEPKKPRPRKQKTISVPADEMEDGLDVLDTLLEACGEELLRARGGDRRSTYYELVDVLHDWLTTTREAA